MRVEAGNIQIFEGGGGRAWKRAAEDILNLVDSPAWVRGGDAQV